MPATRPRLYAHPFSSYSQKALIALYENQIPFDYRNLEDALASAEWSALWPMRRFPVLVDGARTVFEATSIIEHLDVHHPGPVKLIPEDRDAALEVRMLDRFFDNYVSTPQQKVVLDRLRPEADRDARGVEDARAMLETAYDWLEPHMAGREWAAGSAFSLADCAAAPFLFYADWTHPIDERYAHVRAYRERLLARPSFKRAVDEARPYRPYFPLGAPDRD
ncbi:glutathione S-transferase family protein [Lysobacter niastensis]|uniref:Glutathione S-transferase family protein n=1 Tax=Lysobacter niastensis TaxID=380629 RepID=A0ABS0BAT4_9GAMM|nr:glutathione S-transferase family protein [Lysobacter niastensis]MBF6026094.1 glutathione S-transferase family protein [Lysobacter niastensis]